ncbi:signal transduction histidine kinase [Streptomyces sp. V4I2]|nr:signal transduction histidine kinase [Streptomyces sp. V4I2]
MRRHDVRVPPESRRAPALGHGRRGRTWIWRHAGSRPSMVAATLAQQGGLSQVPGVRADRPRIIFSASMLAGPLPWYAQENLAIFAWTGIGATAGDAVRSRRAFVHAIRERAERAERTREEEARRRVAEERLRIARDLHDVVAHHIALVNVQAGVAADRVVRTLGGCLSAPGGDLRRARSTRS